MIRRVNPEIMNAIIEIQKKLQVSSKEMSLVKNGKVSFRNINKYLSGDYNYLSKIISEDRKNDINHSFINYGTDRILYTESANTELTKLLKNYGISSFSNKNIDKFKKIKNNVDFANDLEKVKYNNKRKLAKIVNARLGEVINPYSIFDIQLSIMHESKRQILNGLAIEIGRAHV